MKLNEGMQDYLNFLRHEQGAAQTTWTHYQTGLRQLQGWLNDNGYLDPDLTDFTLPVLRRYMYSLTGLRPRTVRGRFHPLRGLGKFLMDNGALTENPAAAIGLPKKDAAQRKTVTDADIDKLLHACELQHTARQVAFSRAIVSVLVYGGLRRQETLDLKVGDVNLIEKSVLVRCGKGSKSRKVFLCEEGVHALREWLAIREKDCKDDWLFMLDRGRRIHHAGIANLVEGLKAAAGLRGHEGIKPHSLRHAAATRLLRNGVNLRDIQSFLGHSSLQVTAQYLHSDEEQLRNISELTALRIHTQPQPNDGPPVRRQQQQERQRRRIAR